MSNQANSRKHGLKKIKSLQPKSPLYKRRNKVKARLNREERFRKLKMFA